MPEPGLEMGRLAEVETDILYDTGAVINAMPFPAGAYGARTGFMNALRKDGLEL
jgi:hypothetical protein